MPEKTKKRETPTTVLGSVVEIGRAAVIVPWEIIRRLIMAIGAVLGLTSPQPRVSGIAMPSMPVPPPQPGESASVENDQQMEQGNRPEINPDKPLLGEEPRLEEAMSRAPSPSAPSVEPGDIKMEPILGEEPPIDMDQPAPPEETIAKITLAQAVDSGRMPVVDDPVNDLDPEILDYVEDIPPRNIAAFVGTPVNEAGVFEIGDHHHQIIDVDEVSALTQVENLQTGHKINGNTAFLQLLVQGQGQELSTELATNFLYDSFLAGQQVDQAQGVRLPALTADGFFPSNPTEAHPALVRGMAESVGAAALLAHMGFESNRQQMALLPADSPITAIFSDDKNSLAVVQGLDTNLGRTTDGLLANGKMIETGTIEVLTRVIQAHTQMTVAMAQAFLYQSAFAGMPMDQERFSEEVGKNIEVKQKEMKQAMVVAPELGQSETPSLIIPVPEPDEPILLMGPVEGEKPQPEEKPENEYRLSHPEIEEKEKLEVVQDKDGNKHIQRQGQKLDADERIVAGGVTQTQASNLRDGVGNSTPKVTMQEETISHTEIGEDSNPISVEEKTVKIDGELVDYSQSVHEKEPSPAQEEAESPNSRQEVEIEI